MVRTFHFRNNSRLNCFAGVMDLWPKRELLLKHEIIISLRELIVLFAKTYSKTKPFLFFVIAWPPN